MSDQRGPLKKPFDWDELYPGRFMKAGQLGTGKPVFTIQSVDMDLLMDEKGKEQKKGVIAFVETEFQITANKTNGLCLKAMFGRNVQDWIGKRIALFQGQWKGEPAVRIYGSPDIPADISVEIKLARRGTQTMIMHAPRKQQGAPATSLPQGAPPGETRGDTTNERKASE